MKRSTFVRAMILSIGAACAFAPGALAANIADVRTVYLLPMASGLDQYLAVDLTTAVVLQVVTDPEKADAIFTDHLGESLETKLDDLYGSQKKANVKASATADGKSDADSKDSQSFPRIQGASRGRGTAFLIDRKTREVIWSTYEMPKDRSPDAVKRSADRIVERLAKAVKPK